MMQRLFLFLSFFVLQNLNNESMLIYGDDSGAINILYFAKPVTQLFATPFQDTEGVQKVYMQVRHMIGYSNTLWKNKTTGKHSTTKQKKQKVKLMK